MFEVYKENISNVPDINKLYENKQYNLVYDFFSDN